MGQKDQDGYYAAKCYIFINFAITILLTLLLFGELKWSPNKYVMELPKHVVD